MKIGILTFHWAINYGAVLQSYALQQYLISMGHHVEIINYKPRKYISLWWLRLLLRPHRILSNYILYKRELKLDKFRRSFLNTTKEYGKYTELRELSKAYDCFISGSDQVLNPSFTLSGEGVPTDVYYLGFVGNDRKRIGYAVSFGFKNYPNDAAFYSKHWINNFDYLSCRENSASIILRQFDYQKSFCIVPDPTILYGEKIFYNLHLPPFSKKNGICIYMIGSVNVPIKDLNSSIIEIDDSHAALSMQNWLISIRNSEFLITNSYHGMLMAILFHTNFVVIGKLGYSQGQNDRMKTVLEKLHLLDHFVLKLDSKMLNFKNMVINWSLVDRKLSLYRQLGIDFLKQSGL